MRRRLEYHVQYLIELLEPFSIMRGHQISPALQSQVWILGRELHDVSMKFKAIQPPDESPPHRTFFRKQKRRNEPEGNGHGIDAFARDFGFVLDHFRETALPMYDATPIEVALHPLGIMSHSSCGLESFVYGILDYQEIMEYRIGVVRAIEHYYKRHDASQDYLLVQFVNGRGVENWLRLEMRKPLNGASVSFAATGEALTRNMINHTSVFVEDTLPVTGLARQFKVLCDHVNGVDVNRPWEIKNTIYSHIGYGIPSRWTLDEDFLLRHHLSSVIHVR